MLENFLFLLVEEKIPLVDWVLSCGLLAGELLWCLVLHITHADDGCMLMVVVLQGSMVKEGHLVVSIQPSWLEHCWVSCLIVYSFNTPQQGHHDYG